MFGKILKYKEVLLFYILLIIILGLVSMHNKKIDVNMSLNKVNINERY